MPVTDGLEHLFQSTQPKRAATGSRTKGKGVRTIFQSTQPKRAATESEKDLETKITISIHAAQEGCDTVEKEAVMQLADFNPRSPRGLRRRALQVIMRD